jgi:hypothetical protein
MPFHLPCHWHNQPLKFITLVCLSIAYTMCWIVLKAFCVMQWLMHVTNFYEFIDIVKPCRAFTWFFFSHKYQYLSKLVNIACPILKPIPKRLTETDYLNFNKHHKLCQVTSMKLFLHEIVFLGNWTICKAPSSSSRCGFYGFLVIHLFM